MRIRAQLTLHTTQNGSFHLLNSAFTRLTGAGNLETKGSKDFYTFTVPTGGKTLSISWVTCLSNPANPYANGLTRQVTSVASRAKVAGDYCASGNKTLTLAAGDYRLEMGSDITRNSYGTYSFRGVLNG